jgi:hypothetical protein
MQADRYGRIGRAIDGRNQACRDDALFSCFLTEPTLRSLRISGFDRPDIPPGNA